MWAHWNPFSDIKSAWNATGGNWSGRLKVALFYLYVWFLILTNAYQVIVPMSMGWGCLTGSASTAAAAALLKRQFSLMVLAFAMMVEREGPALPNIRFLFGILLVSTIIIYFAHGKGIEQACHWCLMIWILSYDAVVFLAMTFAYVERHTSSGGTSGETQPLV